MAGLVPAISINMAPSCEINRDARVKPAHDGMTAYNIAANYAIGIMA
jgi:hypothetical protein